MKRDLGFYSLGNGISVADSNHEINGDFEKVAHIDPYRNIKYYVNLSPEDKKLIEDFAKYADPKTNSTQDARVFRVDSTN